MQFKAKTYRILAIVLWGVVCSVIGWSIGYTLGWGERKLVFAVVVAAGIYALFILQKTANASLADSDEQMGQSRVVGESKLGADVVRDMMGVEESGEGDRQGWSLEDHKELARQRLDEFLLIQQDK
ncbi:MAG: hypothetical protein A3E37_05845 [Candidatus Andersenbacteria bacterium RIFCSPHIGHO2_12_FULL_46_9]|nr:MAG: hypothetical protein UW94_C0003G0003 [Parcubacteria group bacterium GW2011_GWA2_45_14]OGY33837.1 MAG: hypothetical protein A3B76_03170 [Candidatus Andersenbacteria bacterium RIFCSPHIGHO2_02_FULL_46_16]OGY36272.1 MAG: hypothetical protein A3I08_05490 [Candidatus Andersenbacteria bacterium RIFCSPLOWO2_02_FULL_46_11]OGY37078.1 MAG: hypothetical protein A3E37_05845 [Candidatus Andersenbacteria bacterium RIFCSPHIGHO2_12_FULL_46_9]HBE89927.1 hypothetical protein [Candidatus Andersenbacteria b